MASKKLSYYWDSKSNVSIRAEINQLSDEQLQDEIKAFKGIQIPVNDFTRDVLRKYLLKQKVVGAPTNMVMDIE